MKPDFSWSKRFKRCALQGIEQLAHKFIYKFMGKKEKRVKVLNSLDSKFKFQINVYSEDKINRLLSTLVERNSSY